MGENIKISSLTEEVVRRNKRTSLQVDISKRVEIMNEYHRKLERSGYGQDQIRSIITAGLVGFERIVQKAAKNGTNVNRSAKEGAADRYRKKLLSRQCWFKKKGRKDKNKNHSENKVKKQRKEKVTDKEIPVVSVIFVSKTKHSRLARKMKETEGTLAKLTKERIRIVEKGGKTVSALLVVKDLWSERPCGREGCICCGGSHEEEEELEEEGRERRREDERKKRMSCFRRGLVYEVHCSECEQKVIEHKAKMKQKQEEEEGKEEAEGRQEEAKKEEEDAPKSYVYTGMSHLSGFERGKQHSYLLQKFDMKKKKVEGEEEEEDNEGHMAVHVKLKHEGRKNVRFRMSAVKYQSSAFSRAVLEAVHLKYMSQREDIKIMNGKSEMCSMTLPRLSLQTKSFAKNGNKEGGQEAPIQTQNRSEHPEVIPSTSDQQISISIPTKAKVKLKQTLLSVHLKPKPTKQGAG